MTLIYTIELSGGGPLDGDERAFAKVPADGDEINHAGHSYCFSLAECRFTYRGRWRHFELGTSVRLIYRTYGEALRQLGKLQFLGVITASESLDIQARIKAQLQHFRVDSRS